MAWNHTRIASSVTKSWKPLNTFSSPVPSLLKFGLLRSLLLVMVSKVAVCPFQADGVFREAVG
jgi:hypothetical protein